VSLLYYDAVPISSEQWNALNRTSPWNDFRVDIHNTGTVPLGVITLEISVMRRYHFGPERGVGFLSFGSMPGGYRPSLEPQQEQEPPAWPPGPVANSPAAVQAPEPLTTGILLMVMGALWWSGPAQRCRR
jgi:hypothetical protein